MLAGRLPCAAGAIGAGLLLASAHVLSAQTTDLRWSSTAKTTNPACGEGLSADVVERHGTLTFTFFLDGTRATEVRIALATDGSGRAETTGIAGRVLHEVAAGTGKRPIRSSQVEGVCQWLWMPH
jgi:hypothetical protein